MQRPQLNLPICLSPQEGSIQFKSGSATPMTGYGGMTPSSESGELAGYGMDTSSLGGTGGLYPQESGSYTSTSYNYQQTVQTQYTGAAGQGEASVQQPLSGQSGLTVFFGFCETAGQKNLS